MKKRSLLHFLSVALIAMATLSAEASDKQISCKYQSGDIGTVIGKGATKSLAFENAAEQCFDRHQALVKKLRGEAEAQKRGLLHIDICANISCS